MAHQVSLSWTASTDANVTSYNVYRSTTAGAEVAPAIGSSTTTTYQDTTVTDGTFFYVVTALAGTVESTFSNEVSVAILPAAPTGLTVVSFS